MGLKDYIKILFILAIPWLAFSQTDTIQNNSEYIKTFPNVITVRPFLLNTSNSLVVKSRNSDEEVDFTANKQDRIGASVAFRSIVLSYSFAPDFLSINQDNANSRVFNLNFRTFFGQWMQTLIVFDEKGFFIENDDISVYLPNSKSFKIGGGTSYILNPNFSFKALTSQNEKQVKSVGSFIPRVVYFYSKFKVRDDSGIRSDLVSFDFALAPSYYYNWVPARNLLISGGVSAGIGVNYSESDDQSLTSLLTEIDFRGSLIYDKNNLYLGAAYSYLVLNHNSDRSSYIKDSIPTLEIFFGYRFGAPKSILKLAEKVNTTLGL
jgi:hypothetical protein